jgi:hypothetical protein
MTEELKNTVMPAISHGTTSAAEPLIPKNTNPSAQINI